MKKKVLGLLTSFALVFISITNVFAVGQEAGMLQSYLKNNYESFLNSDAYLDYRYMTLGLGSMQVFGDDQVDIFKIKDYDLKMNMHLI